MIRFKIEQGSDEPVFSQWEEETLRSGPVHTAVQRMSELRQTYGMSAVISIERTTIIPDVDHRQVRFKIALKDNEVRYSKTFPIAEKDTRLTEIQGKFPDASVTSEVIGG